MTKLQITGLRWPHYAEGLRFWAKLIRYVAVGLTSGGIYTGVVVGLLAATSASPALASAVAYLAVMPFAFLGHKHVTFWSSGSAVSEAIRFAIAQLTNMGLSVASMAVATEVLHLPYWTGILAAVTLVPLINFFVLDRWVFR